jgi:hypothetical protein
MNYLIEQGLLGMGVTVTGPRNYRRMSLGIPLQNARVIARVTHPHRVKVMMPNGHAQWFQYEFHHKGTPTYVSISALMHY